MNSRISILVVLLFLFSCSIENLVDISPEKNFSSEINFEISEHLFSGNSVKTIEFITDGYYYSVGKEIFYTKQSGQTSSFEAGSEVISMAFNEKDKSLYFGTYSTGLGKFDGSKTRYYTIENSGLPRNLISNVECDNTGNVWFSSSAHQLGGLIKYSGRSFTKFLPENSQLPDNLIHQIKHRNGKIFIVSGNANKGGTITFEIDGGNWNELFESGGCSMSDLDIDSKGKIYYIDDSREYCGGGLFADEVVFSFSNNQKTILREYEDFADFPYLLKIDKRNYVWVAKFSSNQHKNFSVFNGEKWNEAPTEFPDDFIHCVEVDNDNNIWLGTNNGIYILNQ